MRVLFYYRGIENMGVGYLMSMLKHHGHEIDLIFDPGLDDNLFLKAPHLAWMNRHEELLERAVAFKPDVACIGSLTNLWPFASKMAETGISCAALLHIAAAAPALDWGITLSSLELTDDVVRNPITAADGHVSIPAGPGLGIEVDEAKVRRFAREA